MWRCDWENPIIHLLFLLQALYNEYVHFKETEIPTKELEKGHIEHLYKLLEVRRRRNDGRKCKKQQNRQRAEMEEKVTNTQHHVQNSLCITRLSSGASEVCEWEMETLVMSVCVCSRWVIHVSPRAKFVINAADCLIAHRHMIMFDSSCFILTQLMLPEFHSERDPVLNLILCF